MQSNFNIFAFSSQNIISESMRFFWAIAHWILRIFIFLYCHTFGALNKIRAPRLTWSKRSTWSGRSTQSDHWRFPYTLKSVFVNVPKKLSYKLCFSEWANKHNFLVIYKNYFVYFFFIYKHILAISIIFSSTKRFVQFHNSERFVNTQIFVRD